ncbi:MAG: alpha/beta hydrolase [Acidobacteria bacterium]|nr:MAG: alpha/beta hydrolase [Acidobacteriota bacterium]
MNENYLRRRVVAGASLILVTLMANSAAGRENQKNSGVATLSGKVTRASSTRVTLIVKKTRESKATSPDGGFSFSVQLQEPTYVDLELELQKKETISVFLWPGERLTLDCGASDIFATVRFTGKAAAENQVFASLQASYGRIDYDKLFQSGPDQFPLSLRGHQERLEKNLTQYSGRRKLDAGFLRFERERIKYFGALLRIMRLGLGGDWEEYASHLDFNDPTLLQIDTYSRFLSRYTKAKATQRLATDAALQKSINQVTEARYAVALETYKDPAIRSAQLHEILTNQFVEGGDGPFGCKGIESLMASFDRECRDADLRAEIDKRYRDCLAGRNAPVIRPYKTVGQVSLDAHIFPAAGAKPGDRRPAFLFFHGAGWAAGTPEWGYGACRRLAAQGIVGISFEYRVRWRHGTTPIESVADAKSATRWTRLRASELGIDPERIVVSGFSAGGHLAAATALVPGYDEPGEDTSVSSAPAALVLNSAALDVSEPGWFSECLAGRGDARALSPAQQVRTGLPPSIVFYGVKDEFGSFSKVETFCQNMRSAGNRCELVTFPGGHFRAPDERAVVDTRTDEFLRALGFLGQP